MESVSIVKDGAASEHILEIDPRLYKAAVEGDIEPFNENNQKFDLLVTPIKNTILHIHITSPSKTRKSTEFVKQILEKCPSLLLQVNAKGDTPLHAAARFGHSAIVEVLIERANAQHENEELESGLGVTKQMLRMKNNEGNTALLEAVRIGSLNVVKVLTREDPEFSYSANHCGETPLFIAAAGRSVEIGAEILETCKLAAHEGPDGKTALHVAVMSNDLAMTQKILEKKKSLTKEPDQNGWIPLHYAAYYGYLSIARQLLEVDKSIAYMVDKDRKMTALHMAASQGYKEIMEAIICDCPDCCEMVNYKGWNFLHFAMVGLSVKEMNSFLRNSLSNDVIANLVNAKDVKGNTPLHVLAAFRSDLYDYIKTEVKGYLCAFNKQNDSVEDILSYGSPELKQEMQELSQVNGPYRRGIIRRYGKWEKEYIAGVEKAKDSHLVVAALIATVTFAAAFTMPGGYKSEEGHDQGTAILSRKTAFQAFVITDTMAMVLSLFAVFVHFLVTLDTYEYRYMFRYAFDSTLSAIAAMVVAFVTGTYAVLTPCSGLAISTCLIGLSFFFLLCYLFYKGIDEKPDPGF